LPRVDAAAGAAAAEDRAGLGQQGGQTVVDGALFGHVQSHQVASSHHDFRRPLLNKFQMLSFWDF
jgi:hypothetical protein